MKLRNKKTGEIRELPDGFFCGDNLKKICEEWEDVEEPKEHWFVSEFGKVYSLKNIPMDKERIGWLKQIGNYFESREEAEKAVEKLKAWKRLRDKGIKFSHYVIDHEKKYAKVIVKADHLSLTFKEAHDFYTDFSLIFGGEE